MKISFEPTRGFKVHEVAISTRSPEPHPGFQASYCEDGCPYIYVSEFKIIYIRLPKITGWYLMENGKPPDFATAKPIGRNRHQADRYLADLHQGAVLALINK